MPARLQLLPTLSPLVVRDLSRAYGDRVVLDGVDLLARPGEPLGLVGENGVGKSTLLRLVAGVEEADGGSVSRPDDLGYLPQDPDFPDGASIGDVLDEALAPLHGAVARLERLAADLDSPGAADDYDALLTWATLHEAWDADRRAETTAARLGLGTLDRARPVAAMSGGQRSRLAIAALVTRRPSCVLLDEPTNHLDDDAVALLEEFVASLPGVVVAASHDRAFLQAVCGAVVDLDPAHLGVDGSGGNRFTGGYADYLAAKRDARRRWQEAYEAHQDELDGLRHRASTTARDVAHGRGPRDNDKFIHHFKGANVARTVSRRVRDAERRIEVLERERVPKPPAPLSFRGTLAPGRPRSGLVVSVRDLEVAGRLHVPRIDVPAGERVLVTGANGSGKSTLLKVLAGAVVPTAGVVEVAARRIGHLPQDVTFRGRSAPRTRCTTSRSATHAGTHRRSATWGCCTPASSAGPSASSASGSSGASPWRCSSPGVRTCCSSTSRRTTSRWRWPTSSRSRWPARRGPCWSPATTAGCAVDGPGRFINCEDAAGRGAVQDGAVGAG